MKKVLFLCTGNYYRSRYAEYLFNALAEKQGLPWRADSRGLALELGVNNVGPLSRYTQARLTEKGIPLTDRDRFPQQAIAADFAEADRIIALDEAEHRPMMVKRFPEWTDAIAYWLVCDLDKTPAEAALPAIERRIEELIAEIQSVENR